MPHQHDWLFNCHDVDTWTISMPYQFTKIPISPVCAEIFVIDWFVPCSLHKRKISVELSCTYELVMVCVFEKWRTKIFFKRTCITFYIFSFVEIYMDSIWYLQKSISYLYVFKSFTSIQYMLHELLLYTLVYDISHVIKLNLTMENTWYMSYNMHLVSTSNTKMAPWYIWMIDHDSCNMNTNVKLNIYKVQNSFDIVHFTIMKTMITVLFLMKTITNN